MITEYNRPSTLESALELLARKTPLTVPSPGGTLLNQKSDTDFAVVDIQALPLTKLSNWMEILCGWEQVLISQESIHHPDAPFYSQRSLQKRNQL